MEWWWMLAGAALSAVFTLMLLGLWVQFVVRPSLVREVEKVIAQEAQKAAEVIATRVEVAVKKGLVDGVKALPSRDVLQDTTRTLAKTSAEIMEERISNIFRPRRGGK